MDLHLMEAAPTAEERAAVDELLGPPETAWEGGEERSAGDLRVVRGGRDVRDQRHLLLPALHALQSSVGWISRGGMNYVCQRLSVPPAEAYGVATFYAMFSVEERPKTVVHVCDDLACRDAGGRALGEELSREIGAEGSDAGGWTWHRSPCLGMCEQAPAVFAQRAERHRRLDRGRDARGDRRDRVGRCGSGDASRWCAADARVRRTRSSAPPATDRGR